MRGRGLVLQEQNAYAGATNKLLAKRADKVFVAFDAAAPYFAGVDCGSMDAAIELLRTAAELSLTVSGVCFHVGSGCETSDAPDGWVDAVRRSAHVFEVVHRDIAHFVTTSVFRAAHIEQRANFLG